MTRQDRRIARGRDADRRAAEIVAGVLRKRGLDTEASRMVESNHEPRTTGGSHTTPQNGSSS